MRIVFHGSWGEAYAEGFERLLGAGHQIAKVPDLPATPEDIETFRRAEVMVSARYDRRMPTFASLKLYHVSAAGLDGVDLDYLPAGVPICNCFGHEVPIGEYVVAAMLRHVLPLDHADAELRRGEWTYWGGGGAALHGELAGCTLGLVGYGHIGRHLARLGEALGMRVIAANRSPIGTEVGLAGSFSLDRLADLCRQSDFIVASLPLTPETRGILGAEAFAAMGPQAVVINVGRGPVIDEQALYDALAARRIAGAAIDTWYVYPPAQQSSGVLPGHLPFQDLPNLTMTPHMSGWSRGMAARRRQTIADNIENLIAGRPLINCVRPAG